MVSAASEQAALGVTAEQLAARFGSAYKWCATCTVMVGTIAAILSSTMTNVALPDMMGEFGLGQDQIQWVSTAFLAATTASMLAAAWGVAAFGVRRCFMLSLARSSASAASSAATPWTPAN